MFSTLSKTLLVGLSLWNHKEANKYIEKAIELKRRYRDEINKPEAERDDAVLDNLVFELRLLADSFGAHAEESNA